jgi:hypothetical protein
LTIVQTYVTRPKKKDQERFFQAYPPQLEQLTDEQFAWVKLKFETAVGNSLEIDEHAPAHKGYEFNQCTEMLDELLKQAVTPGVAASRRDLFGNHGE